MNTPELETERLRLRRFTAEDAAAILAILETWRPIPSSRGSP
ncbi:MAG: hypothetical protein ACLRWQ_16470 [Flavonifractor plautii]